MLYKVTHQEGIWIKGKFIKSGDTIELESIAGMEPLVEHGFLQVVKSEAKKEQPVVKQETKKDKKK